MSAPPGAGLHDALVALHEGDVGVVDDLFHEDVEFTPNAAEPTAVGREAVEAHFLAYGGRRERFEILETLAAEPDLLLVRWALHLRSDAAAFSHHGWTRLELVDATIARWDSVWTEVETDTRHWGGD